MGASEADLGSLLKVVRRQASKSSLCKAMPKTTSRPGLSRAQLSRQQRWPPGTGLALIGSYGKDADEMPLSRPLYPEVLNLLLPQSDFSWSPGSTSGLIPSGPGCATPARHL